MKAVPPLPSHTRMDFFPAEQDDHPDGGARVCCRHRHTLFKSPCFPPGTFCFSSRLLDGVHVGHAGSVSMETCRLSKSCSVSTTLFPPGLGSRRRPRDGGGRTNGCSQITSSTYESAGA